MPSVGMRRTPRVFGMVKSSEARILRSGRRLWPDSGEVKSKRPNNDGDEYYHSMKKSPKSEASKVVAEVNGKPKRLAHEENPKKLSRKVAEAENDGGSVDRMFGIVYARKRKRNGVQKSQLSGNSKQKKFGKRINTRQASKRRKTNKDVEESRMFAFVVRNGDCYGWFSSFLCLVLGYVKRAEVRLSELAAFLMSQPISGVYSSNGVNLSWGPPANRTGICKFYEAREFSPMFYVDFSAVPHWFMYMHNSMHLRLKCMQLVPANSDEIMSDSEEDELCVTSVVDFSKSTSGSTVVKIDNLGSKVILHPSVRASKLTVRNAQYRNGLSSRSIQKRRSSLRRRRRARNPSLAGMHKANGALMSDLISSRRNGIPFSSVVSKNKLRSSVRNSSANLSDVSSSISDIMQNIDSLQCSANILVIEPDRCYREEGAIVTLELSVSGEWLLVVKKDSSTKYAHKADKFMRPSSCNRFTHAIIWTGDDNWKLEFANRQDWVIFKDLYKECSQRNVPASTVKVIPVPGVLEVSGYEARGSVLFRRRDLYISLDGDEVSRALTKRTANYDMDSEDEEWLKKFNNEFFFGSGHCEHLSEDCFELIVDAFEKAYFCHPDIENVTAHLCLDLASGEATEAVHAYWLEKRKQRGSALLRVFQGHQVKKAPLVPKSFLRKRRSFKRQASHGRGKQPSLLQALAAEHDLLPEKNAMVKIEEARVSATRSVESAIVKRQRAQLLMQNADMITYKALMALRIAEAARCTESLEGAVAQFFD